MSVYIVSNSLTNCNFNIYLYNNEYVNQIDMSYLIMDTVCPYQVSLIDRFYITPTATDNTFLSTNIGSKLTINYTLNFTTVSGNTNYNTFSTPLSQHKIVLYLVRFEFQSRLSNSYPTDVKIDYTINDTNNIIFSFSLISPENISRFAYSTIVYNSLNPYMTTNSKTEFVTYTFNLLESTT